jgi:multidrug resistance efflux pump
MRDELDRPSSMDIPRKKSPRQRVQKAAYAVLSVALLLGITLYTARLRRADPVVDRSAVLIETVTRGPMLRAVSGQGTLVPEDIRFISALTGGRVERIRLRPGTHVQAETILVDVANPDVELAALEADRQVAQAAADLANLKAKLLNDRLGQQSVVAGTQSDLDEAQRRSVADAELARRGFLSDLEMQKSRDLAKTLTGKVSIEEQRLVAQSHATAAQVQAAEAQLERQRAIADFRRKAVEALHVKATVDGVLQELPLQVGQMMKAGDLLAKVADPTRLKAEVRVPENQAKEVRVGQAASIDTHLGLVAGTVSRVEPAVIAGTVRVEVTPKQPWPEGARPDLSVDGTIELERIADCVYVARPALAEAQRTAQLWKLGDGDRAQRVAVQLGRMSVRTVEVVAGLAPGDRIIVSDMSQWDNVQRLELR